MKEEIKSVSEAFSMQPRNFNVGTNMGSFDHPKILDCIKLEIDPNHEDVYVGYTENGEKLFKFIVKATNVYYV